MESVLPGKWKGHNYFQVAISLDRGSVRQFSGAKIANIHYVTRRKEPRNYKAAIHHLTSSNLMRGGQIVMDGLDFRDYPCCLHSEKPAARSNLVIKSLFRDSKQRVSPNKKLTLFFISPDKNDTYLGRGCWKKENLYLPQNDGQKEGFWTFSLGQTFESVPKVNHHAFLSREHTRMHIFSESRCSRSSEKYLSMPALFFFVHAFVDNYKWSTKSFVFLCGLHMKHEFAGVLEWQSQFGRTQNKE